MKKSRYLLLLPGVLMLISEIWKQFTLTFPLGGGTYNWWYFPFQLCSIPMYVCLILPFLKNEKLCLALAAFLMDYGLLGGIFAFFDTSGMQYPLTALTIHSYVWHVVLILTGLLAARLFPAAASQNYYVPGTVVYLACCCIALFLNLALEQFGTINMFYINPHYVMTQKVFGDIADRLGNTPGIFIYILSCITGAWFLHALWRYVINNYSKNAAA